MSVSLIDGHIDPDTNRMTPQKAIENIDNILNSPYLYDESIDYQLTTDDIECLEMSVKALEKQILKRPNKIGYPFDSDIDPLVYGHCPYCDTHQDSSKKYCDRCGQALDWSDAE